MRRVSFMCLPFPIAPILQVGNRKQPPIQGIETTG